MKTLFLLRPLALAALFSPSSLSAQVSNYAVLRAGADDINLKDIVKTYVSSNGELVDVVKKAFSNIKGAGADFMTVAKKGHSFLEFGVFYKSTTIFGTESSYEYDYINQSTGERKEIKAIGELGMVRLGAGWNLMNIRKAGLNLGLGISGFGEYGYLSNDVRNANGTAFYTVPDTVQTDEYLGAGIDLRLNMIVKLNKDAAYLLLISPGYKFLWRKTTSHVNQFTHSFEENSYLANITLGLARRF